MPLWLWQPQDQGYAWLWTWTAFNRRYEKLKVKQSLLSVKREFNGHTDWKMRWHEREEKDKHFKYANIIGICEKVLTSEDFNSALVVLNILLSSLVDSVQYLVCQRGTQLIPTAAAAYVMAFCWHCQEAQEGSLIRKRHLPLDSDYLDNTGTKNGKEVGKRKSRATKWIKALCNRLKLLFKKAYISVTSCSAAKDLADFRKWHVSWDSCFNSRKPASRYELSQQREEEFHVAQIKNAYILITYNQPWLYYYYKVTLDYTIVLRLWIWVNEVISNTGILKVQMVNRNGCLWSFPGRFYTSLSSLSEGHAGEMLWRFCRACKDIKSQNRSKRRGHTVRRAVFHLSKLPSQSCIHYLIPAEVSECVTQLYLCKESVKVQGHHCKKHLLVANSSTGRKSKKAAHPLSYWLKPQWEKLFTLSPCSAAKPALIKTVTFICKR